MVVIIKVDRGRITSFEITEDDVFGRTCMRIRFDVATPIGDFSFDSDMRPVEEIRRLISDLGYTNILTGMRNEPQRVDIEMEMHRDGVVD